MKKKLVAIALMLAGCVPSQVVKKPGVNITGYKNLGILEQSVEAQRSITDEFARQLMTYGYSVRILEDRSQKEGSDAFFVLNVSQFMPDKKYLIQLGDDSVQRDIIVTNPTVELSGSTVYSKGSAFGLGDGSEIIVSNATVGLSVRMVDSATDEVLWSNAATYEGLDLESAVKGAVITLVKEFPKRISDR